LYEITHRETNARERSVLARNKGSTRASDVMRWEMSWVADDRIPLESSDIGTYEWMRQTDRNWEKEQAAKSPAGGHR
jgi:hypothetical protein